MRSIPSFLLHARQSLAHHLDRLRSHFDGLRHQVRDAVVQAIGQSVDGAVRDTVRATLEGLSSPRAGPTSRCWWPHRPDALFETDDLDGDDQRDGGWHDHEDLDDEPRESAETEPPDESRPTRRREALAFGCNVAAWHLRRRFGRVGAIASFLFGLASAVVVYAVGPGVVSSALSLAAVMDTGSR